MQYLFIFVPLGLFFIAYTRYDIFVATVVLMVATTTMLAIEWLKDRTVKKMHLWVTVMLLVLGTITVMLRDPVYIQWKVTLVHWVFAALLFGSQIIGKKPAVQSMMEMAIKDASSEDESPELELSPSQWRGFNAAWGIYFLFVGALNLFVAYRFEEAIWVKFKVFGIIAMQLVFMIGAMFWLFRHISAVETAKKAAPGEQAGD